MANCVSFGTIEKIIIEALALALLFVTAVVFVLGDYLQDESPSMWGNSGEWM